MQLSMGNFNVLQHHFFHFKYFLLHGVRLATLNIICISHIDSYTLLVSFLHGNYFVYSFQILMITQKCNADNDATCISVIILKLRGGNCIVFDAAKKRPGTGENIFCLISRV